MAGGGLMSDWDSIAGQAVDSLVGGYATPSDFVDLADALKRAVRDWGDVAEIAKRIDRQIAVQCQGTTAEHIRALRAEAKVERLNDLVMVLEERLRLLVEVA
jgi:sugar phosphate isomerase/epimerase